MSTSHGFFSLLGRLGLSLSCASYSWQARDKAPLDPHELFHLLFLGNLSVYDYLFESIYSVMVIGPSVSSR